MVTEILAPTTAAAYSQQFSTGGGSFNISCIGLNAAETATLRFYDTVSNSWNNLSRNGSIYVLMAVGNNNINITLENGRYCLFNTASASPVGISIESQPFNVIFSNQIGA